MTRDARPARVVVIGGGVTAAGLLLRLAAVREVSVVVVDPNPHLGVGPAWRAWPGHPVRGPVTELGLVGPGEFRRWLVDRGLLFGLPTRQLFAAWVEAELAEVERRVTHVRAIARSLRRATHGWDIGLDDGRVLGADAVVLATGDAPSATPPEVPVEVRASPRYVADIRVPGRLSAVPADESVLVLGTGSTAADVVHALRDQGHRARITMLSRRGRLPEADVAAEAVVGVPLVSGDLLGWFRATRTAALAAQARGEPWQATIDGIDITQVLGGLSTTDRARFERHLRPWWTTHRHRVPAVQHAELQRLRTAGLLDVRAGRLADVGRVPGGLEVRLRRRGRSFLETLRVGWLLVATGPDRDPGRLPLYRSLLDRGEIRRDGVGLRTTTDGQAVGADGALVPGLWLLGAARDPLLGDLSSLRAQADRIAAALVDRRAGVRGREERVNLGA